MSFTSSRSAGDSSLPRRSANRGSDSQRERDYVTPESPPTESLTPRTDDYYLLHDTDDRGQTESPVRSLIGHLRLPLILQNILQTIDEGEQLSRELRSALSQRPVPEQHRIRCFASSLCRNCDTLCEADTSLVNQGSDVRHRQSDEELDDGDTRVQGGVTLRSACNSRAPVEPQVP